MNVNLKIENDAELRAYIKDCIRGQVLAIAREEVTGMMKAEIVRCVGTLGKGRLDASIQAALSSFVEKILRDNCGVDRWNDNFVKPIIETQVDAALVRKDWDKLVDTMAKQKISAMLNPRGI